MLRGLPCKKRLSRLRRVTWSSHRTGRRSSHARRRRRCIRSTGNRNNPGAGRTAGRLGEQRRVRNRGSYRGYIHRRSAGAVRGEFFRRLADVPRRAALNAPAESRVHRQYRSIGGLIAIPFQGFYSASKFALEGLSESLRLEVRPFGIQVVLIEPGDHRTSFTQNRRSTRGSAAGSVYRDRFERAVNRMASDEQSGPSPEGIARLLHKILNNPRPRLRYTAGPAAQRTAVWIKRTMPYAVMEKIMRDYYSR